MGSWSFADGSKQRQTEKEQAAVKEATWRVYAEVVVYIHTIKTFTSVWRGRGLSVSGAVGQWPDCRDFLVWIPLMLVILCLLLCGRQTLTLLKNTERERGEEEETTLCASQRSDEAWSTQVVGKRVWTNTGLPARKKWAPVAKDQFTPSHSTHLGGLGSCWMIGDAMGWNLPAEPPVCVCVIHSIVRCVIGGEMSVHQLMVCGGATW